MTATFFVLGENARRFPDLVKRIEVEGHRIANHGDDHGIMMFAGGGKALAQLDAADQALRGASALPIRHRSSGRPTAG